MDRVIVYPNAIPEDTDILNTNKNAMVAIMYGLETMLGAGACVYGLAATPYTSGLGVNIGRGMITQMSTIDNTSYGSIPADTADALLKQGINTSSTAFNLSAPSTGGYAQNFLIEGQLSETDAGPTVLPYYNSASPGTPYTGPSNSGNAQNTLRIQRVSLQCLAGTPAPAGTQATPGTTAGWVPLFIVSVNAGQGIILQADIAIAPGAPFVGNLTDIPQKLTADLTLYVSASGNDANNGLLLGTSFLTLQAAYNALVNNYNLNGFNATIAPQAGTFQPLKASGAPQGLGFGNAVTISGIAGATIVQSATSNTAAISAVNSKISVQNLEVEGPYGIVAFQGGTVFVGQNVITGPCTIAKMFALAGEIVVNASYSDIGNSGSHWLTNLGGDITVGQFAIILTGTPVYSIAFANVVSGVIDVCSSGNPTFAGSASGPRFNISGGGFINTGGAGASFLPGSAAGVIAASPNGGFYA